MRDSAAYREELERGVARRDAFLGSARTAQHYKQRWKRYREFCREHGLMFLAQSEFVDWESWRCAEAGSVKLFLEHLVREGLGRSSIDGYRAALKRMYRKESLGQLTPVDEVSRDFVQSVRVDVGRPVRQVEGFTRENVRAMLDWIEEGSGWREAERVRGRVVLLLGFMGLFRREELCLLRLEDVEFVEGKNEARIFVAKSKGDQESAGQWVTVVGNRRRRYCVVRALREWLELLRLANVRRGHLVCKVVQGVPTGAGYSDAKFVATQYKRMAAGIGLDAAEYAGHSTRAGAVTAMLEAGVDYVQVADASRHASPATTRRYHRKRENAGRAMRAVKL